MFMRPTDRERLRRVRRATPGNGVLAVLWVIAANGAGLSASGGVQASLAEQFSCSPAMVGPNDTLTLSWGVPHPAELAVVRPDRDVFFIAQRRLSNSPASSKAKGISAEAFAGLASMSIVPSAFQAQRWRVGAPDHEPVFTAPGKYTFILGNSLESDDGSGAQRCEVTLKP